MIVAKNPGHQKMIDALLKFGHAYRELVEQIIKTDVELYDDYPLNEIFEEIDFPKWVHASIDKLTENVEQSSTEEFNQEDALFI